MPALHPRLATVYRDRVANLRAAIAGKAVPEALEAARALVDRVIVTPGTDDDPPGIELVGEVFAMLRAGGMTPASDTTASHDAVLAVFASSVKGAQGGVPSPALLARIMHKG